ncbi:unnamed protein product [Echinostoma caproni]|uniref:Glutamyl-tRNA reductase n=1 Tax=Echinostoma caproni TaxID=27848 RepID=A0A183B4M7_9TREM|nr:unnamed protein product [Echinostoma caproni]
MELLGVLPTELESLQIKKSELMRLTEADRALLAGLNRRPNISMDKTLVAQIQHLCTIGLKGEIEVLDNLGAQALSEYLTRKLSAFDIQ